MKNQAIKFTIAFALVYSIPILSIFFLTQKIPSPEKMAQMFGFYLIPSLLAFGLAAILTKKGKPISPIRFGFYLLGFVGFFLLSRI